MRNAKRVNNTKNARSKRNVKKQKKKSTIGLFVHKFISVTFWLIVLIAMAAASYKITMVYYDKTGGPKDDKMVSIVNEYLGAGTEAEEISRNLILSQNEEGQICHIVLEIFNTTTENLDYVAIPAESRFTISNELYQKLCAAGSEAPQILRLKDAEQYFSKETLYEYVQILTEDMLGIDIGYYTAISEDQFNWVFCERELVFAPEGDLSAAKPYTVYEISESFLAETRGLTEEDSLKDFLKEESKEYRSNFSLKNKYEYVSRYLRIQEEYIHSYSVYGMWQEEYFDIDTKSSLVLVDKLINNPVSYTKVQEAAGEQNVKSSKGYQIEILNASGINGLAALYERELTENGYTVTHIGNYTLGSLTETRIVVREEGLGQDLLAFTGKGTIAVEELPDSVDIQILLGTMAEK